VFFLRKTDLRSYGNPNVDPEDVRGKNEEYLYKKENKKENYLSLQQK
jgi:hypothetical protein